LRPLQIVGGPGSRRGWPHRCARVRGGAHGQLPGGSGAPGQGKEGETKEVTLTTAFSENISCFLRLNANRGVSSPHWRQATRQAALNEARGTLPENETDRAQDRHWRNNAFPPVDLTDRFGTSRGIWDRGWILDSSGQFSQCKAKGRQ
jgi:hypothetical protein